MDRFFNFLIAAVAAVTILFAPASFAGDEDLISQYDEMLDKWVSDGFNGGALEVQTRVWLYNNHVIKGLGEEHLEEMAKTHGDLQQHIVQLQQSGKVPASALQRDMSDDKLIRQYDEVFDVLTSTGENIPEFTQGWLMLVGVNSMYGDNTAGHAELMKHIEQKLK